MTEPTPLHPNRKDRGQVEVLAGFGASLAYIANHLNITEDDLQAYYLKELTMGAEEANLKVAQTFFDMATSGEFPQMTLAWLKMRDPIKWSERPPENQDDEDLEATLTEAREKLTRLLNRGK